jgi:hypothetical protein
MTGEMHAATLVANVGVGEYVTSAVAGTDDDGAPDGATASDWLDAANNNGAVSMRYGVYFFSGVAPGLKIAAPTSYGNGNAVRMSVAMRVQATVGGEKGHTGGGYLFAKTTSDGKRYLGLYASPTKKAAILYYKSMDNQWQSIEFAVDVADGRDYRVLLTVVGASATLSVDDVVIGGRAKALLGGGLVDCGAPTDECVTHIGQRASKSSKQSKAYLGYPFRGAVFDARLFVGSALHIYPDPTN